MKQRFSTLIMTSSFVLAWDIGLAEELPPVATTDTAGYLSGELIYELDSRQTPECHASTIVEISSGLVAAWFGGKHEKNPDVGIWVSRRGDDGWSRPVEVANGTEGEDQDYACWNPVLFQPRHGPLMLFYKVGLDPRLWWGAIVTSDDGGRSWSTPRRLGTSHKLLEQNRNLLGPVKNKPIQLDDGTILCGSSTENDGWRVHFELSRDLGKTWEVVGPINDASEFDAIQPSILTYPDGRMQILCRTRQNVVAQSWSEDGGKSWERMTATHLPNPSAGTDAVTLKDGRQLLVYNHSVREAGKNGRRILNVAISTDGQQWQPMLTLENEANPAGYSYPAVIQTSDGRVHITYTWRRLSVKHVVLDPTRLK
jgi:predicted neuraminidase